MSGRDTHSGRPNDPQPERAISANALFRKAYRQLYALAEAYMRQERDGHTLQPTALINEAYLRVAKREAGRLTNRAQFMAVAATAMREVLVDYARSRKRKKRTPHGHRVDYRDTLLEADELPIDVLLLHEALNELSDIRPEHASLVELRFFGGLTINETAEVLATSTSSVERDWRVARAWLYDRLGPDDTGTAKERA